LLAFTVFTSLSQIAYAEEPKRIEAETVLGKFANIDAPDSSNGKFIGIDHTTVADTNSFKYYLVLEKVPATTSINMVYATPKSGDVAIYMDVGGKMQAIGDIPFTSTNGWEPFGETMGESKGEGFYIPEGSTITLIATESVNIDYFELTYNEKNIPAKSDGRQVPEVAQSKNAYISDLKWLNASCQGSELFFGISKDRTPIYESLQIAGEAFDKGLGMASGHYDGSVFVEINIEGLGFTTFASYVGISDSTVIGTIEPSVKFFVEVDGVEKSHSEVMLKDDNAVLLTVDITGAKTIKLYMSPAGDGIGSDCAVWGNAALSKTTQVGEISASPITSSTKSSSTNSKASTTASVKVTGKVESGPIATDTNKKINYNNSLGVIAIIVGSVIIIGTVVFVIIKKKNKK